MSGPPAPTALAGDDRALSSVVGKTLELGLLALYVGLLVSTFYGGVLPEYRASTADSVADRTTAALATDVESAVPATTDRGVADDGGVVAVAVEHEVDVPRTIRGDAYRVRLEGGELVLYHPDDSLSRTVPLALPDAVDRVAGEARSGDAVVIVVESTPGGLVVRLEGR
ncbi:hypothetical protein G9C85_11375 [Halorubellus sp. JP-L1]|uniref:DUF7266 family protein n=1 Tax=Halorubellus sp. JP-L1 TaxID=2715753 RepID=UPI0014096EFC|nr:hypothetical protein [Halorubellus sp. JP-L1]NHN42221.1 hypothetical protein [Halorubellus sp. JP-L1]